MNIEYLKSLFTQTEIEKYCFDDNNNGFDKLLLYILELKKEINSYITELKNYPYLHQYINITNYEILLHYSNIIE